MYYLIHATEKDPTWVSDPAFQAEILMMSTDIKELQEIIKSVYFSNFEDDDGEDADCAYGLDYDLDFNYLSYFTFEHDGPTMNHYSIYSGVIVKGTVK